MTDEPERKRDFHPMYSPDVMSQECVPLVARERKETVLPERKCVYLPSSQFLRLSSLLQPSISVSLGIQLRFFTSPPLQAVALLSSSPLVGFLLNCP